MQHKKCAKFQIEKRWSSGSLCLTLNPRWLQSAVFLPACHLQLQLGSFSQGPELNADATVANDSSSSGSSNDAKFDIFGGDIFPLSLPLD